MDYPGNPSLSSEARERILTTFEQSLEAARSGDLDEARMGVDFVLQVDPLFTPAQTLKGRLEQGAPVQVDDLVPGAPPPASLDDDPFGLDGGLEVGDLPPLDLPGADGGGSPTGAGGEPPSAAPAESALARELREPLERRDFQAVLERAQERMEEVQADPAAREVAEIAQSRLEAQPYVQSFLEKAGSALRSGDRDELASLLEKARSLDPSHPLIAELERVAGVSSGSAATAAPAGEPAAEPAAPRVVDEDQGEPVFELEDDDGGLDLLGDDGDDDGDGGAGFAPAGDPGAAGAAIDDEDDEDDEDELDLLSDFGDDDLLGGGERDEAGDSRIAELLEEGQKAHDEGDLQGAIDAWSRIFLIDVDHDEAARRIENARRLKAERERQVEEVYHEGLSRFEQGDHAAARERFEKVLELQPNHLTAREYLRQIDEGGAKAAAAPAAPEPAAGGEASGDDDFGLPDLPDFSAGSEDASGSGSPLGEEILVPPAPGSGSGGADADAGSAGGASDADGGRMRPYAAGGSSSGASGLGLSRNFLLIGGGVLVLVLIAAVFVFLNRDSLFPNSAPDPDVAATAAPTQVERAEGLRAEGNTPLALNLLRRVRPNDPDYARAQELIAAWEAEAAAEEDGEEDQETTVTDADLERRSLLIEAAGDALAAGENLQASRYFARADEILPLEGDEVGPWNAARRALEPIAREIELVEAGDDEIALPRLWRMLEETPGDRDVRRLIVDIYHNMGVRELQRANPGSALENFEEALALAPDDATLRRHALFAETYTDRSRDLLYRIYVKYLPLR